MMTYDIDCYVSQQQSSWDCDVSHDRHLDIKIRVGDDKALMDINDEVVSSQSGGCGEFSNCSVGGGCGDFFVS
jgi:hypothetical protein